MKPSIHPKHADHDKQKLARGDILDIPTMQANCRSPVRIAMSRNPPSNPIVLEGSVDLGLDPLRLPIAQLPAARRLVGEGLETIAWRLKDHAGSDSLILAESAELQLSAMLCRGETVIALMATGGDRGVVVPAAQGAELYLSLRAVERLLVDALTQAAKTAL